MRTLLLIPIRLYQWLISPLLGNNCRHIPSCSEYTLEAIQEHGAIKGVGMGAKRIIKCHPWTEASFDPVPKKNYQININQN